MRARERERERESVVLGSEEEPRPRRRSRRSALIIALAVSAAVAGLLSVPAPRPAGFVTLADMSRSDVPVAEDGGPALAALCDATPKKTDMTLAKLPHGGARILALSERLIPFRRAHTPRAYGKAWRLPLLKLQWRRFTAKLIAEDAGRAARAGDVARLRRRLLALDRLARYGADEPLLVGQMNGAALRGIAERAAREALARPGVRSAIEAYVAERGPLPDLARGLRGDRFAIGWLTERGDRLKKVGAESLWGMDNWVDYVPAPVIGAVGGRWRGPALEALARLEKVVRDAPNPLAGAEAYDRELALLRADESLSRMLVRLHSANLEEASASVRRDAEARAATDEALQRASL